MKINIDPKKELFKWGPLEFRMVYGTWFIETILVRVTKYYPWPWPPNLTLFRNGKTIWINEDMALRRVGSKYFRRYFLKVINYIKHWQKWEDWIERYEATVQILNNLKFSKLNRRDSYRYLKIFYDLNIDFWLIAHVPEIANWGGEYILRKILKKKFHDRTEEYLEILSAPVKFSFFQQEELDLLKIGLVKDRAERQKAIVQHAKNYFWILNSYGGNRVLKKDYFERKLKILTQEKSPRAKILEIENTIKNNRIRKTRLADKLKLDRKIVLIAEQLSQSIWWQDLRKSYIWRMNHQWDKFLREIVRRTDWRFSELLWCWGDELLDILRGKKVNKKEILKRSKYYAFFSQEDKLIKFTKKDLVEKLANIYLKTDIKDTNKLEGLVVSRGMGKVIRGRVKIISNPFLEENKMRKGDILVAGMTSPEYIIAIRKAAAVITDHGGMTAHAAIVSRELKIPCIVNTKIATKVLKDGQLVEVDANTGIVKIIK